MKAELVASSAFFMFLCFINQINYEILFHHTRLQPS